MSIPFEQLEEIAIELARRPGHEKVRSLLYKLLTDGLGAASTDVELEKAVPEARGRIDALLGRTVFEIKSNLDRELADAESQILRYIEEREAATGSRYIGLATDGRLFRTYEARDSELVFLRETKSDPDRPDDLLSWLDGTVALRSEIPADALNFIHELGRESVAYRRASAQLEKLWNAVGSQPAVALKRQLWRGLLELVYGKSIEDNELWFQHTFLVIVAKAIAARALDLNVDHPDRMLSGEDFAASGVYGAVESDFFDWVLDAPGGYNLVREIAKHVSRFRLESVDTDVLKILYESLVDPEQRKELGEYYTPDWLAAKVTQEAVSEPLTSKVLDPACGSGTFLFHAIRSHLVASDRAGTAPTLRAKEACRLICGIDVHPVAVIIARVTYLLGLGDALQERAGSISIPVYLGDAMQMQVKPVLADKELVIDVPAPEGAEGNIRTGRQSLNFPEELCARPQLLDDALTLMREMSEAGGDKSAFAASLRRKASDSGSELSEGALTDTTKTYATFDALRRAGRDTIWSYVARNLGRPLYFSAPDRRADVVVGNPPWIALRYMSAALQRRFKEMAKADHVFQGGNLATQADIAGLFFSRTVTLYLKDGGRIAFVMPRAALTRGQFESFRKGTFLSANVRFETPWDLDGVAPLFPVPSAVVFATKSKSGLAQTMPDTATAYSGQLPYRDAPEDVADAILRIESDQKITTASFEGGSPYREAFHQGATLVPRVLCTVERVKTGKLGGTAAMPRVRSRRTNIEKPPWKTLSGIDGQVEVQFLRPVYLGESIAPFRVLGNLEAVIPYESSTGLMNANEASVRGYTALASWLRKAELAWEDNKSADMAFKDQLDYYGKLTSQFPIQNVRVVYAKAGSNPAAAIIEDNEGVIDHKLYWATARTREEAHYLVAIFNAEAARSRIEDLQSRGQWGARDFDKVMFNLPIPRFDPKNALHQELASAAAKAEEVAMSVALPQDAKFQKARKLVRATLSDHGISDRIDKLVNKLLGPA
jgi:hypothetical protein